MHVQEPANAGYYTEKARQCFLLADLCLDDTLAARIREIAYEFVGEAMHRGADPRHFRTNWHRQHGKRC